MRSPERRPCLIRARPPGTSTHERRCARPRARDHARRCDPRGDHRESFAKDDSTFLFAQGVADPSSMWGTLKGIGNRFGEDRVIEMPIAENGAVGIAIGAAIAGQRPIISFHRVEFALLAFEQIVNNAAKSSLHQQWPAQGAAGHSHGDRTRLGPGSRALAEP